ncbi:MAG: HD domain-containing protein [Deltaproteobacteria bacterium]|nr:HD domain-containing protein [Deltaproteobacteria bacterium]MCB9479617.1 HD domain-containing protein [Deltaproteobacteria bacterium]MCB9488853.1 HD domain-containing protein [Deltaproteobacteria bacterium]
MSETAALRRNMSLTEEILKAFSLCLRNRSLYPEGHTILRVSDERLVEIYNDYFQSQESWTIVILGGEIVFEKVPLNRVSLLVRPLLKAAEERGISSLSVRKGVTADEIAAFLHILTEDDPWEGGNHNQEMLNRDIHHILLQRVDIAESNYDISTDTEDARDIYASMRHALTRFFVSLFNPRSSPSLDLVHQIANRMIRSLQDDHFALISRLHTRRAPDDLVGHSINTAIIAYEAGKTMGLTPTQLTDLFLAGLLHDVGKMDIPPRFEDGIIHTSTDPRILHEHPLRGVGILQSLPTVPAAAIVVVYEHHRGWDGSGYPTPSRASGERRVNLLANIIAIANAYERYLHGTENAKPEEIPPMLIRKAGEEFEPRVLAHFITAVGMYPPGTFVKLTTNETAMVVDPNRSDPFRPVVQLLRDADGEPVDEDTQINLADRDIDTGHYIASVRTSVPSA